MKSTSRALSALCLKNPKEVWKRINLEKQNELSHLIMGAQWFDHFRRLHQMKVNDCQIYNPILKVMDDVLDARISVDEVYDLIRQMKSGKAPGMDGMMVDIYKVLPPHYLDILVGLWNKILETSQIPQHWCTAIIIPIPKSGDKMVVSNYRGITPLPVIVKLLFATISKRLYMWARANITCGTVWFSC